jgi:Thioredoxin
MNPDTTSKKLTNQDYKAYFEKGITYNQYALNTEQEANSAPQNEYSVYVPQNWQRMKRIAKTLELITEIRDVVSALDSQRNWLVISEHWCGDASQIVPILSAIADASEGKIKLKIVYRDQNLELMDAHLTNNGRSIPKLLILDENFDLLDTWGPRPVAAQKMVMELKKNPETADKYAEIVHKWYADDKQKSTQMELLELIVRN